RRTGNDFCLGAMRKLEERAGGNDAALLQKLEVAVPSDFSQREDRARLEKFYFALEVIATIRDLAGEWLVVRRRAATGGRNVGVDQLQSIVAVKGSGLIREACFVQGSVQEITGAVAGEHSTRAIRPMRRRCQAQDQQLRVGIPKSGN